MCSKGRDEGLTLHFPFLRNETERGIDNKEAGLALEKTGPVNPKTLVENRQSPYHADQI